MKNIYFEIIKILEHEGKYKQADLVEKFLKTSQFDQNRPRGNAQNPFENAAKMFDPFAYLKMQNTFNQEIVSGPGRALDFNNLSQKQLSPYEIQLYKLNPKFQMEIEKAALDIANSYSQATGINAFLNHVNIIDNALFRYLQTGMVPTQISQEYQERFDNPLQMQITRLIDTEQNVNNIVNALFGIIDRTNYLKRLDAFTNSQYGTIAKALSDSLQKLKPKPPYKFNPLEIAKYNSLIQHPRLRSFVNPQLFPIFQG